MTELVIDLFSFGYQKSGIPEDETDNNGGFVFDCRFLPNPGREPEYADLTGKDAEVISYLEKYSQVKEFLEAAKKIVDLAIENYLERGFAHLMISFGCTGGQHRSVYCAEHMRRYLAEKPITVKLHHTELERGQP
ncbi:hypothetical protein B6D60_07285 [candidate division KSB1 bacterium 4484_87]|nr:MAG: hypothetical protein B6D60_07285 [candidate division KSB1 bacterium 4484_87]